MIDKIFAKELYKELKRINVELGRTKPGTREYARIIREFNAFSKVFDKILRVNKKLEKAQPGTPEFEMVKAEFIRLGEISDKLLKARDKERVKEYFEAQSRGESPIVDGFTKQEILARASEMPDSPSKYNIKARIVEKLKDLDKPGPNSKPRPRPDLEKPK